MAIFEDEEEDEKMDLLGRNSKYFLNGIISKHVTPWWYPIMACHLGLYIVALQSITIIPTTLRQINFPILLNKYISFLENSILYDNICPKNILPINRLLVIFFFGLWIDCWVLIKYKRFACIREKIILEFCTLKRWTVWPLNG